MVKDTQTGTPWNGLFRPGFLPIEAPGPAGGETMDVLIAHREKREGLYEGMDALMVLHDRLLKTWVEIIALRDSLEVEGRVGEIEQLHQVTKEIAESIIEERKALFGSIASLSELDISSRVDSMVLQKSAEDRARATGQALPASQAT